MKIIKRNGSEEEFDRQKIKNAIAKANISDDGKAELTDRQIDYISLVIEDHCKELGHALSVEEIQELVETHIILQGAPETAKRYIRYRFTRNLVRESNTTDNKILSLIERNNEEAKQENSNKNPVINSTQRDYMAGEVSRDLSARILLPKDKRTSGSSPGSGGGSPQGIRTGSGNRGRRTGRRKAGDKSSVSIRYESDDAGAGREKADQTLSGG